MIAMLGFDPQGEGFRGSSPLSVPTKITDNNALQPTNCPKGQLDQR